MAFQVVDTDTDTAGGSSVTFKSMTPVSGRAFYIALHWAGGSDAPDLTSITGTNGWNVTVVIGFQESPSAYYQGLAICALTPSSSTAGALTANFAASVDSAEIQVMDWDGGATSGYFPSTPVGNGGIGTSYTATHGTMADGTNGILLSAVAASNDFTWTADANYTDGGKILGSDPLAVLWIVGNGDLTCNESFGTTELWRQIIIEITPAAAVDENIFTRFPRQALQEIF